MVINHVQICIFLCADPLQVNWLTNGCETRQQGSHHTECLCNHLTYFSILVVRNAADPLLFYKQETNIWREKARQCSTQKYTERYNVWYFGVWRPCRSPCPSTATGVSPSVPPPGFDQHYISGLCCVFYQLCRAHHLFLQEEVIILL